MKNQDLWKGTKYEKRGGVFRASLDPKEVSLGSRFMVDLQIQSYTKAIEGHARGRLLDLGCGKVPLYEVYRDFVEENICIDWTDSLHESPHLDFEFDLNQSLPLEGEEFDTIVLTDVLEHIANPDSLWREMTRLLKPGGKVIVGVPFLYWIHEHPHDYYRYTEFRLRKFCEENNLSLLSLEAYGGALEVLVDITSKLIGLSGLPLSRFFLWVYLFWMGLVSRSWLGRKIRKKTEPLFPLGYCLVAEKGEER